MARRVTIMIDEDLDKKLRLKQGKLIEKSLGNVSYSSVINNVIRGKIKL